MINMWLIVLLIIVVLLLLCFKALHSHTYWTEKGVKQEKQWPIFGSIGPLVLRKISFTETVHGIYNAFPEERYCGMYQFYTPALLIRCPNLIKLLTITNFNIFPEHRLCVSPEVDPLFGNNILNMRGGQKWHDLRAILTPSFTGSKLKGMFRLMEECTIQCIKHYQKQGGPVIVEMKDLFTRYTNDVIATAAFGVTCNSFENPKNEFYLMGKEATEVTAWRLLKLFMNSFSPFLVKILRPRVVSRKVEKVFRNVIMNSIRLRESKNIIRSDMIHLLMESRKANPKEELTDDDIVNQAFMFLIAGFDTTSEAMCFTCYELALNPDIQKKLQDEVDSISELTYDSLLEMKYLDMVISESLRKWPPIQFTERRSVAPVTIEAELPGEKPIYLDKHSEILIPIFALHRDPKYFPEPDKFDPERFSDDNKHNINHLAYLPFGTGLRYCIGMRFGLLEVKLAMFYTLRHFNIIPTQKTPIPIVLDPTTLFPFPKGGFWMELQPRTNVINS